MPTPKDPTSEPNPIDVHVGSRVRMRRKLKGMSQEALATRLGLTFQQVQKYERGTNRISASKLFQTARALDVSISDFFEGLEGGTGEGGTVATPVAVRELLTSTEGLALAEAFGRIRRNNVRRRLVNLFQALSTEETAAD